MNDLIFQYFFSLSSSYYIAKLSLLFSYELTYLVCFLGFAFLIYKSFMKGRVFVVYTSTIIFSWFLAFVLKLIFQIERPFIELSLTPLFYETGYSFPSEHMAFLSAFSLVFYKINRKIGIVLFVFTLLVGISRMVIGVHYTLDVAAGWVLGVLTVFAVLKFFKIYK